MSINSWPWRSIEHDRTLTSNDLALFFSGRQTDGVSKGLVVKAYSGMTVQLEDGFASIKGRNFASVTDDDGPTTIDCGVASGSYPKYVSVFLRMTITERTVAPIVKDGTPAADPVRPAIQRDANVYELRLADILVPKGVTAITQDMIHNTIAESECGMSVNQPYGPDTEQFALELDTWLRLYKSAKDQEFVTWFEGVKDVLDANTAGNLYNMFAALPRIIIQEGDEIPPVEEGAILIRK